MAKKLSEYLGIAESRFEQLGTFNPILSVDSRFFIDPKSLSVTSVKEFIDARKILSERYSQIFALLSESSIVGDRFWKTAFKHFPKGEVKEICVGYGFDNTDGRGIGPKLVAETIATIKEFINSGIDDPALFELIGLFQKGIGSDIVSDMTAKAIIKNIIEYTTRITTILSKETKIKPHEYTDKDGKKQLSFFNVHNKRLVYLLPSDILQPLPVAYDWESIDRVCTENERVRNEFAKLVGAFDWKKATRGVNKDILKKAMLAHPDVIKDILRQYRDKSPKQKYDFANDPAGEYIWYEEAKKLVDANPLSLPKNASKPAQVDDIVKKIIANFKRIIENNGGWMSLYTRGKYPVVMHESYAQKLFFGVADAYCEANDIDISPETNSGRGPIDFKFSNGSRAKVLVEIKLSSNQQLEHGFTTQVGEYEKAEKPHSSYYLVLDVTADKTYMKGLNTAMATATTDNKRMPLVEYVDAKIKKPASKA